MADQPSATPAKQKKKGSCLRGCLTFFLVALLLAGIAAAMIFNVPRRLGWVKAKGTRFTDQTPERITAEEILTEAEAKGFESEGVKVYAFPDPEADTAILFVSYDFSEENAALTRTGSYNPVVTALVLLGGGEKAKEYAITHVGAEFRDEEGRLVMEVAASTADIRELQEGKITEDAFINERLGTRVDLPNYFQRAVMPF